MTDDETPNLSEYARLEKCKLLAQIINELRSVNEHDNAQVIIERSLYHIATEIEQLTITGDQNGRT